MKKEIMEEAAVRKYLGKNKVISVPALQKEFGFSYTDARKTISALIDRAWVTEHADGVYYGILHDNMIEICLSARKAKKLFEVLTADCFRAIKYLSDNGHGSFSDLLDAVQGVADTNAAIEILINEKVIRESNGNYHLCLSQESVDMLNEMNRTKPNKRRRLHVDEDENEIRRKNRMGDFFESLVDDDDDDDDDDDSNDDNEDNDDINDDDDDDINDDDDDDDDNN